MEKEEFVFGIEKNGRHDVSLWEDQKKINYGQKPQQKLKVSVSFWEF